MSEEEIEILIKKNMKLVYAVYNRLPESLNKKKYKDDLISVGTIGLWKGLLKYDETKFKQSTFLYPCIYNEMAMLFRNINKSNNDISLNSLILDDEDNECTVESTLICEDDKDVVFDLEEYINIYKKYYTRTSEETINKLRIILSMASEGYPACGKNVTEKINDSRSHTQYLISQLRKALILEGEKNEILYK